MDAIGKRYRAFISYSQRDQRWAKRVHRALETYRVPVAVDTTDLQPPLSSKRTLGRLFRDDDELGGASSLGAAIEGALRDSEYLIVLCSPHAARSQWVDEEVRRFRTESERGRVLAVIVDGIPNATEGGDHEQECFPPALRRAPGKLPGPPDEPLAPNLRKESFGKVITRLVAGLLDQPFDSLWQREQRRRRQRRVIWGGASLVVLSVFVWGLLDNLESRRATKLAERNSLLAAAVDMLGAGRAEPAFETLQQVLADHPEDPVVTELVDATLAWARSAGETLEELPGPLIYSREGELYFKPRVGSHTSLGPFLPERRIGFADGKMLLIYADQIVLLDLETGAVLDRLDAADKLAMRSYSWPGLALQAPDGTGLVGGYHGGISNSQYWHTFLVYHPGRQQLSLVAPVEHPEAKGDLWRSRYMHSIRIASGCRSLGIPESSPAGGDPTGRYFLIDIRDGLHFSGAEFLAPAGDLAWVPDPVSKLWFGGAARPLREKGCRLPKFDTLGSFDLSGPGGLIPPVDADFSPPGPSRWNSLEPAPEGLERGYAAGRWTHRPASPHLSAPCVQFPEPGEPECRVVDGPWAGQSLGNTGRDLPGWVRTSMPPAGDLAGALAEVFAEDPVRTYHAQYNAGIESAWCRRGEGVAFDCVSYRHGIEFRGNWSSIDLRSRSGRFVLYSADASLPVQIFDVLEMLVTTPARARLAVRPGAAAFSDGPEDRLFLVVEGLLRVLEPDLEKGAWVEKSAELPWSRRLAGELSDDPVISLTALPSDELIVTRESSSSQRLNWRNGTVTWTSTTLGIGEARAVRRSPDSSHLVVIGSSGMRLLRSRDGLPRSGVMMPPYLFDPAIADRADCSDDIGSPEQVLDVMSDVTVSDRPEVILRCGRKRVGWRPVTWQGDRQRRIEALLGS